MWVLGAATGGRRQPGLGWLVWRPARTARSASAAVCADGARFVWLMQTAMAALLLFLLWHPALSVATLKPQQNIVAVVVDNSASMATGGRRRLHPQRPRHCMC